MEEYKSNEELLNNFVSKDVIEKNKPSKEMLQALKEAEDMRKNPDKYPSYDNWDDLKESLFSNK